MLIILLQYLLVILQKLVMIYSYAIMIFVLMSWLPGAYQSKFGQLLGRICQPFLQQFSKIIPPLGMIDISPIVAYFVLILAQRGLYFLGQLLQNLGG